HRRGRPGRDRDAGEGSVPAHLGTGPAPRRLELLLVPAGPGGQLLRVLLGPGLHRRRRAVDPADLGRHARPVQLGAAATPVVPGPGGPGRADDRLARARLMAGPGAASTDCDVLVVGYGPVGQTLTILLAQRGYRVTVLERKAEPYPRPRAVHYDDEIARVFAAAGIGEAVAAISQPSGEYDWQNAEGRTLLHFDWGAAGLSGWPASNMFAQPRLEAVLAARAESLPGVEVRRGWQAARLAGQADRLGGVGAGSGGG